MRLKPCPFCGKQPDIDDPDAIYPVTRDKKVWRAGCIESAGGCGASVLGDSAEHAVEQWNKGLRLNAQELDDLIMVIDCFGMEINEERFEALISRLDILRGKLND